MTLRWNHWIPPVFSLFPAVAGSLLAWVLACLAAVLVNWLCWWFLAAVAAAICGVVLWFFTDSWKLIGGLTRSYFF